MAAQPKPVSTHAPAPARVGMMVRKWDVPHPKEAPGGGLQKNYGFALLMPAGARIVSVTRQHQTGRVFAVVNPSSREVERYFWVTETNLELPGPEDMDEEFRRHGKGVETTGLEPLGSWLEMNETVARHLFEIVVRPVTRSEGREPGED